MEILYGTIARKSFKKGKRSLLGDLLWRIMESNH